MGGRGQTDRGSIVPTRSSSSRTSARRVTRYCAHAPEPRAASTATCSSGAFDRRHRRWISPTCPTGMLNIGMHPAEGDGGRSLLGLQPLGHGEGAPRGGGTHCLPMLCLPFSDPAACVRQVETFGGREGVTGFMVTTVRHLQVNNNAYMQLCMLEEHPGLRSPFRSGRTGTSRCSAPAIAYLPCTRFDFVAATSSIAPIGSSTASYTPNCRDLNQSGLAWVPFLMQRLDHEFHDAAVGSSASTRKPSDYMRDMYSSQPIGVRITERSNTTFPHDERRDPAAVCIRLSALGNSTCLRPSTTSPFLLEKAKHNILSRTQARLFQAAAARRETKEKTSNDFSNLTRSLSADLAGQVVLRRGGGIRRLRRRWRKWREGRGMPGLEGKFWAHTADGSRPLTRLPIAASLDAQFEPAQRHE